MVKPRKVHNEKQVRNVLLDLATGAIAALLFVLFALLMPTG